MTELVREKLKEKQSNLLETYKGLKNLQRLSQKDLAGNIEYLWAVAFGLVAAIEATMDIAQYIIASRGKKAESYGNLPDKMLELGIIDSDFAKKFRKMIGFRNRAIHNYPSLDTNEVCSILQNDIDDFKEFLRVDLASSN